MNLSSFVMKLVVVGLASTAAIVQPGESEIGSPTVAELLEKDEILCGSSNTGFNTLSDNGETYVSGFDVEFCKAFAAAIFGDVSKARTVPVSNAERFQKLHEGGIDVLAPSTHTMERDVFMGDVGVGFSFSTVVFYDGLKVFGDSFYVGCTENYDVSTESGCDKTVICVGTGTSWWTFFSAIWPSENLLETTDDGYQEFLDGKCNLIAGESADIVSLNMFLYKAQDPKIEEYIVSKTTFTKEPLAWVTRQDDVRFSDIINWVIMSTIYAEENDITKENATTAMSIYKGLGEDFEDMFIYAVAAVGNYGEIYNATLESTVPRQGINLLNTGGSGRIYSLPLLGAWSQGPLFPPEDGTLQKIINRGFLSCGIISVIGGNGFNFETMDWEGYDVDYCRALSAAIFRDPTRVEFVDIPAKDRFPLLESGLVDVLSRRTTVNLKRDMEIPTMKKGFSFTSPNFYDGQAFGGIPSYVECAEALKVTGACKDLQVCVARGTTTYTRTSVLFPDKNIVPTDEPNDNFINLNLGICSVITADSVAITEKAVRSAGYEGDYVVGSARFSKEPLALVTRQDDPHWSDFVRWVVEMTMFAEEVGVNELNAKEVFEDIEPIVHVFGPLFKFMAEDVVRSVGNYGDIYRRNLEASVPRSGLNLLNDDDGPQMYALPMF